MAPSPDREPPFTALGRTVVLVADAEAAPAFYRDVLGFAVLHDRAADGYRHLHIGLPGPTGQPTVGLWLMPAATARERDLIGRQCGGQPMLVLGVPWPLSRRARARCRAVSRVRRGTRRPPSTSRAARPVVRSARTDPTAGTASISIAMAVSVSRQSPARARTRASSAANSTR
ncbi:VOC family protein [Streptomyces sp. NBC_01233]|uniref:VOC family protein n=1 Tax=Streptomyces sp. NBC_01233 TaxID=2903787 RepID=UPI002E103622|nr:hypothetical protein OG332_01475 [Streptomyces sp. NBC_01233]